MKNKITISYAPDDRYLDQTIVSMTGAVINNPHTEFVILYSNLNAESLFKLEKFKTETLSSIRMVKIDPSEFDGFPMSGWVTKEAWFRVKLPDLCPDLDRILYLDCDTVVNGDLSELWETNLEGCFLGAVEDVWDVPKHIKRLGLVQPAYFNSGVILFNCKYCRENKFYELVKNYATSTEKKIKFCDQDVLNVVTDGKKVLLNPKYNYLNTWWRNFYYEYEGKTEKEYLKAADNPVIIHYTGIKPCFKGCAHPLKNLWQEYAEKSIVYDELKSCYENSMPPKQATIAKKLFSIKNTFSHKKKIKTLTILGIKIPISGNLYRQA